MLPTDDDRVTGGRPSRTSAPACSSRTRCSNTTAPTPAWFCAAAGDGIVSFKESSLGGAMSELIVRASTDADVARCAEIYGHHVLYGTASFEVDPPDLAEMKKRRAALLDLGLPHLVAERAGKVLGYAYAGNWRPR